MKIINCTSSESALIMVKTKCVLQKIISQRTKLLFKHTQVSYNHSGFQREVLISKSSFLEFRQVIYWVGGGGLPKIPTSFYHLLLRALTFDNQKEDSMQMLNNGFLLTLMHNKLIVNFTTDYSYNDTLLGSVKERR